MPVEEVGEGGRRCVAGPSGMTYDEKKQVKGDDWEGGVLVLALVMICPSPNSVTSRKGIYNRMISVFRRSSDIFGRWTDGREREEEGTHLREAGTG